MLVLALFVAAAQPLCAQGVSGRDVITRAIAAYQDLDFDLAAGLLRRALDGQLADSDRVRALAYLGAAEHYRVRPDSAIAAFRQLATMAPGYQPDTLVFPPEVTIVFNEVRRSTPPPAPPPAPPPPPSPVAVARVDTTSVPVVSTRDDKIIGVAGGTLATVRAQSPGSGLPSASGVVFGIRASARYRRLELGIRYLQGSLATRDLAEGAATLAFTASPWLTVQAGPQIRHYETPFGAERWMTWRVGARGSWSIVHASVWKGLGLRVNVPPGTGSASGGELGVTVKGYGPFWFGLTYGIDDAAVKSSSRRERVQTLSLSASLRKP